MNPNETNPANETDQTTEPRPERPKRSIYWTIEPLPNGRSRVRMERRALEHVDQLRLGSELQREMFAKACDAKEPGCYDEVLAEMTKQAMRDRSHYSPRNDEGCRFVFTSLDKIEPKPIDWLWEKYIPAGMVTILEGEPGVGKTMVLADLAARVTRGFLAPDRQPAFDPPGFDPEPCPELVWWFGANDAIEETLAPRLRTAGADPAMVRFVEGTEDMRRQTCRAVSFPEDFDPLWKCKGAAPRLVIVDPLSSFCGGKLNYAVAVKVMRELAKFAATTGAAVVVVRPLNRRSGVRASDRGSAGQSVSAEARSVLLLGRHPDDPSKQVLAAVKCNLCAIPPSQELEFVEGLSNIGEPRASAWGASPRSTPHADAQGSPEQFVFSAPIVSWLGTSALRADELVQAQRSPAKASHFEQKKVEEWLGEKLKAGPKPAKEIDEQAKLDDVPPILLRRAKISLNIHAIGKNGSTTWALPALQNGVALNALNLSRNSAG